ncbi:hypothetical protein ACFY9S_39165 [Streptomyces sp. NPDC012474]|uniref:hypothetical protein n=1 Tax=Streptomyces sp. NPDC012474 TaxID=3364836 RepID=UPI0036E03B97
MCGDQQPGPLRAPERYDFRRVSGLHPATVVTAPLVGLATGVLARLHPAWRASRIQPAEALRR